MVVVPTLRAIEWRPPVFDPLPAEVAEATAAALDMLRTCLASTSPIAEEQFTEFAAAAAAAAAAELASANSSAWIVRRKMCSREHFSGSWCCLGSSL